MTSFIDKVGHHIGHSDVFTHSEYSFIVLECTSKDFPEGYRDDFEWRLSLWKSESVCLTRDTRLAILETGKKSILFYEMESDLPEVFLFVHLFHKHSGIPVGEGYSNAKLVKENPLVIPMQINSNILNVGASMNNVTRVDFEVRVGVHLSPVRIYDDDSVDILSAKPGNVQVESSAKWTEMQALHHTPRESLVFSNYLAYLHNSRPYSVYRTQETEAVVSQSYYYLSIDDLQLAPDILDLYSKRSVLVTAGFLDARSKVPSKTYLGNISNFQGSWAVNAFLVPLPPSAGPCDEVLVEVSVAESRSDGAVIRNVICSGVLSRDQSKARVEDRLAAACFPAGEFEVLLHTDFSRDQLMDDSASQSSTATRLFVGRARVALSPSRPASDRHLPLCVEPPSGQSRLGVVDELADRFIGDTAATEDGQTVPLGEWLLRLSYVCQQLCSLDEQFALLAEEEGGEQSYRLLKARLLACIGTALGHMSRDNSTSLRGEIIIRLLNEQVASAWLLDPLRAFMEDWLASPLFAELVTAAGDMPVVVINVTRAANQSSSQYCQQVLSQFRQRLCFNTSASVDALWRDLHSVFYYLQLVGGLVRACPEAQWLDEEAKYAVTSSADYEGVCEMSADLLQAALVYSGSLLSGAACALRSMEAAAHDKRGVRCLSEVFTAVRGDVLTTLHHCLAGAMILFDNVVDLSETLENAVTAFVSSAIAALECLVSCEAKLSATAEESFSSREWSVSICKGWKGLLYLLSYAVDRQDMTINRQALHADLGAASLPSVIDALAAHVIQCTKLQPDLARCGAHGPIIVGIISLLTIVTDKLCSSCEEHPVIPATAVEEGEAPQPKLDGGISALSPWQAHSAATASSAVRSQVPDHSRRRNFAKQSGGSVTFSADNTPANVKNPSTFSSAGGRGSSSGGGGVDQFRSAVKRVQSILKFQVSSLPKDSLRPAGPYSGEMLLHFFDDNHAYLTSIHNLFVVLLRLQPSNWEKAVSMGVVRSVRLCKDVVDCALNALFKGREHHPAFVTRVCDALAAIPGPSSTGLLYLLNFICQVDSYHLDDLVHSAEVQRKSKSSNTTDDMKFGLNWVRRETASVCDYLTVLYTKAQLDVGISAAALEAHRQNEDVEAPPLAAAVSVPISVPVNRVIVMWFTVQQRLTVLLRNIIRYCLLLVQQSHTVKTVSSTSAAAKSNPHFEEEWAMLMGGLLTSLSQCTTVLCNVTSLKQLVGLRDDIVHYTYDRSNRAEAIVLLYQLASDLPVTAVDTDELRLFCHLQKTILSAIVDLVVVAPSAGSRDVLMGVLFQLIENSVHSALTCCEESLGFEALAGCPLEKYLSATTTHANTGKVRRLVNMNESRRGSLALTVLKASSKEAQVLHQLAQLLAGDLAGAAHSDVSLAVHTHFSLHFQTLKLLLASKCVVQQVSSSPARSAADHAKLGLGRLVVMASLGEAALHSIRFGVHAKVLSAVAASDDTAAQVVKLDQILRWLEEADEAQSGGDSSADAFVEILPQNLSNPWDLTPYIGFGHQAYLSLLRLLLQKERHLLTRSDDSRFRECEIQELRTTLKYCLTAGHWEQGIALATAFKQKHQAQLAAISDSSSSVGFSPKRTETISSELNRTIDKFRDRIKFNDHLRLFPLHYALRFFSSEPWEAGQVPDSEELQRLLAEIDVEGFTLTSSKWFQQSSQSAPKTKAGSPQPKSGSYEYWLVLRFDMTSNIACVRYFQDYLDACASDVTAQQKAPLHDLTLLSPICYQVLSAQVSRAFPEYTLVSPHHMIESYITKKLSGAAKRAEQSSSAEGDKPSSFITAHRCKYLQVFPAFPTKLCSDVYDISPPEPEPSAAAAAAATDREDTDEDGGGAAATAAVEESREAREGGKDSPKSPEKGKKKKRKAKVEAPTADDLFNGLTQSLSGSAKGAEEAVDDADDRYLAGSSFHSQFNVYSILSEEVGQANSKAALDGREASLQFINRYQLSLGGNGFSLGNLGNASSSLSASVDTAAAALSAAESELTAVSAMNVCPCSIALLGNNNPISLCEASLEVLFHTKVTLMRAYKAIQQLNKFTAVELANEPADDISNSFSVFVGIYSLLSNLLGAPSGSCIGLHNLESIIVSERERIEVDWQQVRKEAKKVHMRELQEFEDSSAKSRGGSSVEGGASGKSSKNGGGSGSGKKPVEPALEELRAKFNQSSGYQDVELLAQLRDQVSAMVAGTLAEMRRFNDRTAAKPSKAMTMDDIRSAAIKRGRRPTLADNLQLTHTQSKLEAGRPGDPDAEEEETFDDERSLRGKMLLFLEAQFAAIEVGLMM